MKKEPQEQIIHASGEWIKDADKFIAQGMKQAGKNIYDKYGNETPFPMFLHVALCQIMEVTINSAPNMKEAEKFILNALNEVKSSI